MNLALGSWTLELRRRSNGGQPAQEARALESPLAGVVDQVLVRVGDQIQAGQVVAVVEESEIETKLSGRVVACLVRPGALIAHGQALLEVRL